METIVISKLTQEQEAIKERVVRRVIKRFPELAGLDPEVTLMKPGVVTKTSPAESQYDFVFRKSMTSADGIGYLRIVHVLTNQDGDLIDIVVSK